MSTFCSIRGSPLAHQPGVWPVNSWVFVSEWWSGSKERTGRLSGKRQKRAGASSTPLLLAFASMKLKV